MNPACYDCKFLKIVFTRDERTFGMCRRYPPVPYFDTKTEEDDEAWPITDGVELVWGVLG